MDGYIYIYIYNLQYLFFTVTVDSEFFCCFVHISLFIGLNVKFHFAVDIRGFALFVHDFSMCVEF